MICTVCTLTFAGLNIRGLRIFTVFAFLFSRFVTSLHKCCLSSLNFHGMKLSWMAINPRKPRKFNPAKVKAYTVLGAV